jgi:hypothetical protein
MPALLERYTSIAAFQKVALFSMQRSGRGSSTPGWSSSTNCQQAMGRATVQFNP